MNSITARMTVWFALAVTLAVFAALAVGRLLLAREIARGVDNLHSAEFREVQQQLGSSPDKLPREELIRLMRRHSEADEDLFFFQVHERASGRVLFRSPNLGDTVLPDVSEPGGQPWTLVLPIHGHVRGSEFEEGGLYFQIASRMEPMERVLRQYVQVSGLLVTVVAIASFGIGYALSRVVIRPLGAIERAARQISAENLAERIPVPPGRDEITELVVLLNGTFDRLEQSFKQIRQFSADASHELKTPLTLIRLSAERVRNRAEKDSVLLGDVEGLLEEIAGMQQLIDRLLFLAKAEGGALKIAREEQPTDAFINFVAEDAIVLAEDARCTFQLARNDAGAMRFDSALLRQVLLNLVSNAVSVMPDGGRVLLESTRDHQHWQITVGDEGPGLPMEHWERIFERFVQLSRPNQTATPSNGLGLAICRSIVQLHGGQIKASNRKDRRGLQMTITIPI